MMDDLRLVRLRRRLSELAHRYPHLVRPEGADPATWERTLEEAEASMVQGGKRVAVAFRLSPELVERLDRYTARVAAREDVRVTRTDALESLLGLSLDILESLDHDPALVAVPASVRAVWDMTLEALEAERNQ